MAEAAEGKELAAEEKRKALDERRRVEEERIEMESELQKCREERARMKRKKEEMDKEKKRIEEVRSCQGTQSVGQPAGKPSLPGSGTQPGPLPEVSERRSRRVFVPRSTGGVPILDGVKRRQPVGAYGDLPLDYGRREPFLRPFHEIPAHQDASESANEAWAQKGRDLSARASSLKLSQEMRESELKQLERKMGVILNEKRLYEEECEERVSIKRRKLAPDFKIPNSIPPREEGGLVAPVGPGDEPGLRIRSILELAGGAGESLPVSVPIRFGAAQTSAVSEPSKIPECSNSVFHQGGVGFNKLGRNRGKRDVFRGNRNNVRGNDFRGKKYCGDCGNCESCERRGYEPRGSGVRGNGFQGRGFRGVRARGDGKRGYVIGGVGTIKDRLGNKPAGFDEKMEKWDEILGKEKDKKEKKEKKENKEKKEKKENIEKKEKKGKKEN